MKFNHVCIFIVLFLFLLFSIFLSIIILCLPFVANIRVDASEHSVIYVADDLRKF